MVSCTLLLQGAAGTISGLASSVAFTPAQGIELVDPDAVKKAQAEAAGGGATSSRFFDAKSGFASVAAAGKKRKRTWA